MTPRSYVSARRLMPLVTLLAALSALTGQAHASTTQESIFQDDRLLQNYGLGVQADTLDQMQRLGVNTVHVVVNWNSVAPGPTSGSVPAGFHGADPADPKYNEERLHTIDELVRGAQSRGMGVILVAAGPAPAWGVGRDCTSTERRTASKGTCRPNPVLYGDFVTALAKRYDGTFLDANQPFSAPVPRITRWGLWNEPNLGSWIYPSQVRIRGKRVAVGARIYRDLVYAGGGALRSNGHSSDQVLLGETAPIGRGSLWTSPVDFYHALFCLGDNGKRLTGSVAKNLGCSGPMKRLPVTGVAHHPYTKGAAQRLMAKQHSNDITIANIAALRRVLAQGVHARAITSSAAKRIYFTEFGVSSTPPAKPRSYGVSLAKQAEYINQFEYIAYQDPTVRSVAQFQLEDDKFAAGSVLGKRVFQTGLLFFDTREPKPAYAAYKMPLFVVDRGKTLTIWGGLRGGGSSSVKLLNGRKVVKTIGLRNGYFTTTIKRRSGTWQLTAGALVSRVAKPVKPGQ